MTATPVPATMPPIRGMAFFRTGLLTLVFALVVVVGVWGDRQSELLAVHKRAAQQASLLSTLHAAWLSERFAALTAPAATSSQRDALFLTWARVDAQGRSMGDGDATWAARLTPADKMHLAKTANGGPQAWRQSGADGYRLAVALGTGGVMVASPRMESLKRMLDAVQGDASLRVALMDDAGEVIAAGQGEADPWPAQQARRPQARSGFLEYEWGHAGYLGDWHRQDVTQSVSWVVQRRADALLPFRERAAYRLLTLAILAALLMLAGARVVDTLREQRRLLAVQQESDQRWRSVQAMSTDWYWQQDEALRFVRVGAHSLGTEKYPEQTFVGQCRWDLPAINMSQADWDAHKADLEARRPFRNLELQLPRQNGQDLWMEISGDPIFDESGLFTGYRGVGRDITQRKAAQAQQEALAEELRQAQKMEALGTLAGGIAHDFNNILGALLGNLALVRDKLPQDHPVAAHLGLMDSAGERARRLVQQVLTFSRHQQQVAKSQCLAPVVEEVASLLRATHPATIHVRVDTLQHGLPVLADATQIHQVLMNLGTNACHALPHAQGRVGLGLSQTMLTPQDIASFPSLQPGPHACLTVQDNGLGMDASTVRRVFEPFFTTKAPGHGTGLGLAVVHGIVNSHRGAIRITSQPGEGTRFEVFLPLASAMDHSPVPSPDVQAVQPAQGMGQHILCVDDDETMRLTTQAQLQHWGYRVTTAASGEEALATLQTTAAADVALVLSDHSMPGMTGFELWREIKVQRPQLAMIINSGYLTDELFKEARQQPRLRLVMKETAHQTLGSILKELLGLQSGAAAARANDAALPQAVEA